MGVESLFSSEVNETHQHLFLAFLISDGGAVLDLGLRDAQTDLAPFGQETEEAFVDAVNGIAKRGETASRGWTVGRRLRG